ncbi:MAG TPA: acyl-CoA dehydrogenase family protein [Amycolatopsis sp.]|nr:acyl-CoA dehydrogenase family protein [Amycolatopsis sp.]
MDFELGEELRSVRQWVRDFGERAAPREYIRRLDDAKEFPEELYQKMAEAGFMSIAAPEEFGGSGGDIMMQAVVCEELSRIMQGSAMGWFTTSCFGVQSVGAYGTDEQKKRLVPGMCDGSLKFAISITEPGGGTDVLGAMKTRAEKVDGGWRVTGAKAFTTGAHVADYLLVICRTSPPEGGKKHTGISALLVDPKSEGVAMDPIRTLGLNTVDSFSMSYDNVFVPDENVLGEPGKGWRLTTHTLNNERILTAAMCVGIATAAFDDALAYAKEREAFGSPIGKFQSIANYLVKMRLAIEQSRLLTYRAAWMQSQGLPCGPEATMSTLVASQAVSDVADTGIQILGGLGYTMEADMQRYWRDTRQLRIGPISNEMSANYLAASMGLPKSY